MSDTTKPTAPETVPEFTADEIRDARNARVTAETGIRPEFIQHLKGDTTAELIASARVLLEGNAHIRVGYAPPISPRLAKAGVRPRVPAPAAPATPDAPDAPDAPESPTAPADFRDVDGRPDPEKLAVAIRRNMPY